ncbi:hypothetical protein AGABI2DRAFT_195055 [Agaricus bisporus var. bisporus H97]|uniref:hypothetical protein n=1 Tax=Agaricus bisporus var. bisporus (strain H97 / ATCC MYA-4626 / FGSC 10389) TaxID=936046 RepID=UPI00029F623A|nr:hypothetical protein AGABI2DRAFT_195055 [Agaricus bisporus var. bisporus H97]EKV43405.1 hypothetical protein AGABI2DRAFT_195055 [Agaricus bisporus var. bisporus H97]
MFSTLIRQQAPLAFSARLSLPLHRQLLRSLPAAVQKPNVVSQRAFSVSRTRFAGAFSSRRSEGRDARSEFPEEREKTSVLYVGNIPFTAGEVDIRELFEPYGQVKRVTLASDRNGRLTGFGFVEYDNMENAVAAIESSYQEPFALLNRTLKLNYAHNRNPFEAKNVEPAKTISIANFPIPGDERPLRHLMQKYEEHIVRINFMKNADGEFTSRVFIEFADQENATAALEAFQDYNFEGTMFKIDYAKPKRERRSLPPRRRLNSYDH